jgi:uncharacterized protein (DUF58 family)
VTKTPQQLLDADLIRRLDQLALVSRKMSTGRMKGERRSRRRGASTEFADYRNYMPGDDLRFLDWKIYGRLDRLFIKLFLEEEDLRVYLLIDASPSMEFGQPAKLLYAKRLAAALGYLCLTRMDSLVVKAFGDRLIQSYGPRRGKANSAAFFGFLGSIRPAETTSLLQSFKTFAQTNPARGIAVVISDFYDFDGYEDAFRQLFARDFEVLAIQVLSPEEIKPGHQGDIRLLDAEFSLTTDISMGKSALDAYARTLSAFCGGLKDYLGGHGGHFLFASTDTPFERLILDVLRRRGIIK